MRICTIRTRTMGRELVPGIVEPGAYELDIDVNLTEASATGDVKGFINMKIAQGLASCVAGTSIPLGEGQWNVFFTPFAQNNFNFPGGFTA